VLFYPALIYYDLSGMGGYDGFASPMMIAEHSAEMSTDDTRTSIYYLFQVINFLWLASLVNLVIGIVIFVDHLIRREPKNA
jgi:hypothetical protein